MPTDPVTPPATSEKDDLVSVRIVNFPSSGSGCFPIFMLPFVLLFLFGMGLTLTASLAGISAAIDRNTAAITAVGCQP